MMEPVAPFPATDHRRIVLRCLKVTLEAALTRQAARCEAALAEQASRMAALVASLEKTQSMARKEYSSKEYRRLRATRDRDPC